MAQPLNPSALKRHQFQTFDGQTLSYLEAGPADGPTALLIHGFVSSAEINWVKGGTVNALAQAGFHVYAPDLRGHGQSAKPHEDDAYPHDVLALDQEALLAHVGTGAYHLVGYSLGAITAARMITRGAQPKSLILSGMGDGMTRESDRRDKFIEALTGQSTADDPFAKMVTGFVKRTGGDAKALAQVMRGRQAVSAEEIAGWRLPCLVLCGAEDDDNGSATTLGGMIPGAEVSIVPGTHMDAIFKAEFVQTIAAYLKRQAAL